MVMISFSRKTPWAFAKFLILLLQIYFMMDESSDPYNTLRFTLSVPGRIPVMLWVSVEGNEYVYIESAPKAFPMNISGLILLRLNYPQSSHSPSNSRIQFREAISSINAGPSTLSVILYFLYIQMIGPAIASTSQA